MTIKELKEIIKDLPDNMDVFIGERISEFTYGLVNSARLREIHFYDDSDPENEDLHGSEEGLVLTEE